jgi:hypothetical protein
MEAERQRQHACEAVRKRQRTMQSKIDRAYEDYLEGKISDALDAEIRRVGGGAQNPWRARRPDSRGQHPTMRSSVQKS